MLLLGIAIPTYSRLRPYSALISDLSRELLSLPIEEQESIRLSILENPSSHTSAKKKHLDSLPFGAVSVSFAENTTNIGGDSNIAQAYQSMPDCMFTWVIGDDERIRPGSLFSIISCLRSSSQTALLLLSDTTYILRPRLRSIGSWPTYLDFARSCAALQPHLLIAHTLISSNIVRTECIDIVAYMHDLNLVKPRLGLKISFAHMKAIVSGLSRGQGSVSEIQLLSVPVLDTSQREDSNDPFTHNEILLLYRHYINWLFAELGLDTSTLVKYPEMTFYNPPVAKLILALIRSAYSKWSRIISRKLDRLNALVATIPTSAGNICR